MAPAPQMAKGSRKCCAFSPPRRPCGGRSFRPASYGSRRGTFPAAPGMETPAEADWLPCPGGGGGGRRGRGRRGRGRGRGGPEGGGEAALLRRRLTEASSELRGTEFWEVSRRIILPSLGDLLLLLPPAAAQEGQDPLAAFRNLQLVPPARRDLGAQPLPQEGPPGRGAEEGVQCVCYGLGNFSSCAKARCQLAFLLLLLQELQIPHRQCHVFDPVFSELEIETLNSLSLTVVLENEEGKRRICGPTLFYMVHCGKALYNNLLWRNWSLEALPKMVIVGNSFRGIEERVPARTLKQEYAYIAKIVEATREAALPSHPQYLDVFNDTSVHCFPLDQLRDLPREVWECPEEPFYQDDDQLEIIRNKR